MQIEELYRIFLSHPKICTDTRSLEKGSLFFALRGEHFDANSFAAEAIEKGAAWCIIDNPQYAGNRTILVDNSLQTLQNLASFHRSSLSVPVIGITGSNGKTTTKELINAVLSTKFRTSATSGNFNNHIGVPLTVLSATPETEMLIVEMGANHIGEIRMLSNLSRPTHGIITNIGKAHLGGFGGYHGVIKAKSELYENIRNSGGTVFVNGDDELLMQLSAGMNRITYGMLHQNDFNGRILHSDVFMTLEFDFLGRSFPVKTRLVGEYNFSNVMAAMVIGISFGVEPETCISAIEAYEPKNSRSELVNTGKNKIILDAYNANPSSMEASLINFSKMPGKPKMVILGGMKELGQESDEEHDGIVNLVSSLQFDAALFAGPEFIDPAGKAGFQTFENSGMLLEWLRKQNITGYTILIKGSRGTAMEKVLPAL